MTPYEQIKESLPDSVDWVQRVIAEANGFNREVMTEQDRHREKVIVRQYCIYACYHHFNYSLKHLGRLFGGRDNSTILHSVAKVNDLFSINDKHINEVHNNVRRYGGDMDFIYRFDEFKRAV